SSNSYEFGQMTPTSIPKREVMPQPRRGQSSMAQSMDRIVDTLLDDEGCGTSPSAGGLPAVAEHPGSGMARERGSRGLPGDVYLACDDCDESESSGDVERARSRGNTPKGPPPSAPWGVDRARVRGTHPRGLPPRDTSSYAGAASPNPSRAYREGKAALPPHPTQRLPAPANLTGSTLMSMRDSAHVATIGKRQISWCGSTLPGVPPKPSAGGDRCQCARTRLGRECQDGREARGERDGKGPCPCAGASSASRTRSPTISSSSSSSSDFKRSDVSDSDSSDMPRPRPRVASTGHESSAESSEYGSPQGPNSSGCAPLKLSIPGQHRGRGHSDSDHEGEREGEGSESGLWQRRHSQSDQSHSGYSAGGAFGHSAASMRDAQRERERERLADMDRRHGTRTSTPPVSESIGIKGRGKAQSLHLDSSIGTDSSGSVLRVSGPYEFGTPNLTAKAEAQSKSKSKSKSSADTSWEDILSGMAGIQEAEARQAEQEKAEYSNALLHLRDGLGPSPGPPSSARGRNHSSDRASGSIPHRTYSYPNAHLGDDLKGRGDRRGSQSEHSSSLSQSCPGSLQCPDSRQNTESSGDFCPSPRAQAAAARRALEAEAEHAQTVQLTFGPGTVTKSGQAGLSESVARKILPRSVLAQNIHDAMHLYKGKTRIRRGERERAIEAQKYDLSHRDRTPYERRMDDILVAISAGPNLKSPNLRIGWGGSTALKVLGKAVWGLLPATLLSLFAFSEVTTAAIIATGAALLVGLTILAVYLIHISMRSLTPAPGKLCASHLLTSWDFQLPTHQSVREAQGFMRMRGRILARTYQSRHQKHVHAMSKYLLPVCVGVSGLIGMGLSYISQTPAMVNRHTLMGVITATVYTLIPFGISMVHSQVTGFAPCGAVAAGGFCGGLAIIMPIISHAIYLTGGVQMEEGELLESVLFSLCYVPPIVIFLVRGVILAGLSRLVTFIREGPGATTECRLAFPTQPMCALTCLAVPLSVVSALEFTNLFAFVWAPPVLVPVACKLAFKLIGGTGFAGSPTTVVRTSALLLAVACLMSVECILYEAQVPSTLLEGRSFWEHIEHTLGGDDGVINILTEVVYSGMVVLIVGLFMCYQLTGMVRERRKVMDLYSQIDDEMCKARLYAMVGITRRAPTPDK
ncbi:hypothetical protein KIPB_004637, partial [Kipferlia bialata]